MKRFNIHAPGSDQYEEHPEGEWVEYEDAQAELQKERDRRVEHRQQNQALNEALQNVAGELVKLKAEHARLVALCHEFGKAIGVWTEEVKR